MVSADPHVGALHALASALRVLAAPVPRDDVERLVARILTATTRRRVCWEQVVRRALLERVLDVDRVGRWQAGPDIDDVPHDLDIRAVRMWGAL